MKKYTQLFPDNELIFHISIFTQNDSIIQKIYTLASELSMNEKIIVKTFESRNMHHVIIRDHIAHYFINALHTLIENYYETSS